MVAERQVELFFESWKSMGFRDYTLDTGYVGLCIIDVALVHGSRSSWSFLSSQATLMRNIPSAVLRFGLYEELKHRFASTHDGHQTGFSWKVFLSGAVAGGVSSGLSKYYAQPPGS